MIRTDVIVCVPIIKDQAAACHHVIDTSISLNTKNITVRP